MFWFLSNNFIKCKFNVNSFTFRRLSDKPSINVKEYPTSSENAQKVLSTKYHAPNKLERTILVWTKMYKSKDEIPRSIPIEAIEKARNKARIKLSNYMILATAVACVFVAISGRKSAERGESVVKMNLDWHKKIKEEEEALQK